MPLCDWFAGIDINDRQIIAAIGSSDGDSVARVHGSRAFSIVTASERDRALRELGEWFRLESGGNLSEIGFTVPGTAYHARPARGECRFTEAVLVDDEMVDEARQRALVQGGFEGPVLCSAVRQFDCDGRTFPEAPLGLAVRSLSADVVHWVAEPHTIELVSSWLDDIGFTPGLIAPRAVALAEEALAQTERHRGAAALCVDADFTDVVVYRDDQLIDLFTIPLGTARLNRKLANACGLPLDLVERLDLQRMLTSRSEEPIVQRVRTIVSVWGLSLMRAIRERLETSGPVWQLGAGLVIADSARKVPLLAESVARAIGIPARFAVAEHRVAGAAVGEPLPAHGLIRLQWRLHREVRESSAADLFGEPAFPVDEPDERGIGPVISRWLREFVPTAHAP